ncbi:DUF3829 domain-containing protein [Pseudomonas viridiflava]|uniref:DUF3829 domain-containing protein n=1 Tax=Pseudomonas viridiflava TaxID=33069 RepID=UPI000F02A038|nr:DUF3829 domain-containing protein [Pseudomonas viridiflava]
MNPKWLIPIAVTLGLGLVALAGASRQVAQVQLWLDQRDGPETAKASALAPIIDCINRVDRDWRLFYYGYTHKQWYRPYLFDEQTYTPLVSLREFGDRDEAQGRELQNDICARRILGKLERLEPDSQLINATGQYVQALQDVTPLTNLFDFYQQLGQKRFQPLQGQTAQTMVIKGDAYLAASTKLRKQLEREDVYLRPAQLALLQSRFGHETHWHLLNYMITARTAVDELERGAQLATLTPQTLASFIDAVQRASTQGKDYVRLHPSKPRDEFAIYLWRTITPAADAYLQALQTLQQHWQEHATPQQLSDDFALVTHRYDVLLSFYNKPARSTF